MGSEYVTGSPGVTIEERELATFINPVSVSVGGLVGDFAWGPVDTPTVLMDEDDLLKTFGKPDNNNYKDWFTAKNYLSYAKNLWLTRVVNEETKNACDFEDDAIQIKTTDAFTSLLGTLSEEDKTAKVYARYPGIEGNKLRVVISDKTTLELDDAVLEPYVSQMLKDDDVACGVFYDGALVEFGVYSFDKKATDINGNTRYIVNAINTTSTYIFVVENKLITYDGVSGNRNTVAVDATLVGGTYTAPVSGDYILGWDSYKDAELIPTSMLMQGGGDIAVGKHIISIAEYRRDAVACVSPAQTDLVNVPATQVLEKIRLASTNMGYSSYRVMDGNYKYQYDPYNDVYRWVPLNGDVAGCLALTDAEKAPWYSPGGKSIKNAIKLAFNPNKVVRDEMYKYLINPICQFAEKGVVLWGDWTGADVTSPFNYVNVRRCFLYIEKTIAQQARTVMWENNNDTTQTRFFQSINPFLRGIQADGGIQDYKIVCDGTVNNAQIVMAGKFVAKIFIKPVYSIRWVVITFVATRSDADFEEIVES